MPRRLSEELTRKEMIDPQLEKAGVARRVEGLRERMSEAERQVEGLFESLLSESFGGN
jgi:hypothetical protein